MDFIFFGTADFGLEALQALVDAGHNLKAVVTNPAKPAGRGLKLRKSPVELYCEEHELGPVLTPENLKSDELVAELKAFNADIFVVVAFSILPEKIFKLAPKGTFNIHAALLPKFRGPAPIHRAIERGETETGVTVFRIDKGVDTGNMLHQKSLTIKEGETTPELYYRLSSLGAAAIKETFYNLEEGGEVYYIQDHEEATHAPLLKKSEAVIDWSLNATDIANKVRAFKPFPGTHTTLDGKKLEIIEALPISDSSDDAPGTIIGVSKEGIDISCGEGILRVKTLKAAGKRAMSVQDFINGSKIEQGIVVG